MGLLQRSRRKFQLWLLEGLNEPGRARDTSHCTQTAFVVAGDVPHWRRLFLDAWLPTRHRFFSSRRTLAYRYSGPNSSHALRRTTDVPARSRGESSRRRLDLDAREPAVSLEGKTVCARLAGLRRDELYHHDHALRCRRHRTHCRESVCDGAPGFPAPSNRRDARFINSFWRRFFAGFKEAIGIAVFLVDYLYGSQSDGSCGWLLSKSLHIRRSFRSWNKLFSGPTGIPFE